VSYAHIDVHFIKRIHVLVSSFALNSVTKVLNGARPTLYSDSQLLWIQQTSYEHAMSLSFQTLYLVTVFCSVSGRHVPVQGQHLRPGRPVAGWL